MIGVASSSSSSAVAAAAAATLRRCGARSWSTQRTLWSPPAATGAHNNFATSSRAADEASSASSESIARAGRSARRAAKSGLKTRSAKQISALQPPTRPLAFNELSSFPTLLYHPDPVLDVGDITSGGTGRLSGAVEVYGGRTKYEPLPGERAVDIEDNDDEARPATERAETLNTRTGFSREFLDSLHLTPLITRRISHQTGKGASAKWGSTMLAGNGKGLVGIGSGKALEVPEAKQAALVDAVRKMDYVERFEQRTIERTIIGKFSACKVYLRPRPPGFGLRCPPVVYMIARACGISDLSASIIGSTNRHNVAMATLNALWGGNNPIAMGDGFGGKARRRDRGGGLKGIRELELERGRRFRIIGQGLK